MKSKRTNILTIDVEDYYMDLNIEDWEQFEDRILSPMDKILKLLEKNSSKATFFIIGYIAEKYPDLVKEIVSMGHEIASHGYNHLPVTCQTPLEFENDLKKSKTILETIIKEKIIGYRACQFSLCPATSWMIDVLKKNGFKYDSSIFPVKTPLYGVPTAPHYSYLISSENIEKNDDHSQMLEIPLSVFIIPYLNVKIPVAGGFYFRLFPYAITKKMLKKLNDNNHPIIFYIHPWEFDPEQPRIGEYQWYHYYRLGATEKKFKNLLHDFQFTSIKNYYALQNI